MSGRVYIALLHHPVFNKAGEIGTSSITNHDLHDLGRLCVTYGLAGYFVVTPLPVQRKLGERLIEHWVSGPGAEYNWTRKEAFRLVRMADDLAEVRERIREETGRAPKLVMTTAKPRDRQTGFGEMRRILAADADGAWLVIFGTGWGLAPEVLAQADYVLEPVRGRGPYNHLSVRSAAGIILDRLCSVDRADE